MSDPVPSEMPPAEAAEPPPLAAANDAAEAAEKPYAAPAVAVLAAVPSADGDDASAEEVEDDALLTANSEGVAVAPAAAPSATLFPVQESAAVPSPSETLFPVHVVVPVEAFRPSVTFSEQLVHHDDDLAPLSADEDDAVAAGLGNASAAETLGESSDGGADDNGDALSARLVEFFERVLPAADAASVVLPGEEAESPSATAAATATSSSAAAERFAAVLIADYGKPGRGESELIATLETQFAPHKVSASVRRRSRAQRRCATMPSSAPSGGGAAQRKASAAALPAAVFTTPLPHDRATIHTGGGASARASARDRKATERTRGDDAPALAATNDSERLLLATYRPQYDASKYGELRGATEQWGGPEADDVVGGVSIFKPSDSLGAGVAPTHLDVVLGGGAEGEGSDGGNDPVLDPNRPDPLGVNTDHFKLSTGLIVKDDAETRGDFDKSHYGGEFADRDTRGHLGCTTAPIVNSDADISEAFDGVFGGAHEGRDTASVLGRGTSIVVQADANTVDEEFGAVFDDRFNGKSTESHLGDGTGPHVELDAPEQTFAFRGTLGLSHAGKRSKSNFMRSNAPLVHPDAVDCEGGFDGAFGPQFEGKLTETQLGAHTGIVDQVDEASPKRRRELEQKQRMDVAGQTGTSVAPLAQEHRSAPPWTRPREGTLPYVVDMLRRHFTVQKGGTASMFKTFKRAQYQAGVSKAKAKKITATQFNQILDMAGMEVDAELLRSVFDVFDRDGDGAIDLEDFKVAIFGDLQGALPIPAVEIIAGRTAHRNGRLLGRATNEEGAAVGDTTEIGGAPTGMTIGSSASSAHLDSVAIVEPADPLERRTLQAGFTLRRSVSDNVAAAEGKTGLDATTAELFRSKMVRLHKGSNRPMKTFLTFRRYCNAVHNEITESEFFHGLELLGLYEEVVSPAQAATLFRAIDVEGLAYVDFNSMTNFVYGQTPYPTHKSLLLNADGTQKKSVEAYTVCEHRPPVDGAIGEFVKYELLDDATRDLLVKVQKVLKRLVKGTTGGRALSTFKRFRWMVEATDNNVTFAQFKRGLDRMAFYDLPDALSRKVFDYIDVDGDGFISFNDFAATFFLGKVLVHKSDLITPGAGRQQLKERDMDEYAKTIVAPTAVNAKHILSEVERILRQMSARSATHLNAYKRFKWMSNAAPDDGVSFQQFRTCIARCALYSVPKNVARECFNVFDVKKIGEIDFDNFTLFMNRKVTPPLLQEEMIAKCVMRARIVSPLPRGRCRSPFAPCSPRTYTAAPLPLSLI